jgi:hypothetical protein
MLAMKKENNISYEKYREIRQGILLLMCQIFKLKNPELKSITGIAIEKYESMKKGVSEDLIYFEVSEYTESEKKELEILSKEYGILNENTKKIKFTTKEYP